MEDEGIEARAERIHEKKLKRYVSVDQSMKGMDMVNSLEDLKDRARCKFNIDDGDMLTVVEQRTGIPVLDDSCLMYLKEKTILVIINESKGEKWPDPPSPPWQLFEGPILVQLPSNLSQRSLNSPPREVNGRNSGGPIQWNNIQAEHVHQGPVNIFTGERDLSPEHGE